VSVPSDPAVPAGPTELPDPYPIVPFDGPVDAVVRPPGSKSLTNRALVAAALASGTSRLEGVLLADDTEAMLECVARLGAGVAIDRAAGVVEVEGTGGRLTTDTPVELQARLSGTTSRFVAALLALGPGPYRLDGGPSLRARPMGPVLDAVAQLGASVTAEGEPGHLPVTVSGGATGVGPGGEQGLVRLGGDVSSQFTSGLMLAGACLPGGLRIELTTPPVSRPYLDLTAAVMAAFGAEVRADGPRAFVVAAGGYRGTSYRVEPDASAASYLFSVAAVCGGRVRIEGLGTASLQGDLRFVDALERMGCAAHRSTDAIEVVGGPLHGIEADFGPISDTAQTIAAVAAFAEGPTRITGIGFIRRKETDRIAAVVTELRRAGVDAVEEHDGFLVHPGPLRSATVQTYDDHRMAMSFALLGLRSPGIAIAEPACVAKTFPDYFRVIETMRPRSTT
jgi:3-phosphoshikimate 1-carboxyvinyltransferase